MPSIYPLRSALPARSPPHVSRHSTQNSAAAAKTCPHSPPTPSRGALPSPSPPKRASLSTRHNTRYSHAPAGLSDDAGAVMPPHVCLSSRSRCARPAAPQGRQVHHPLRMCPHLSACLTICGSASYVLHLARSIFYPSGLSRNCGVYRCPDLSCFPSGLQSPRQTGIDWTGNPVLSCVPICSMRTPSHTCPFQALYTILHLRDPANTLVCTIRIRTIM